MPELPEVETTVRGITPHIEGHPITDLVVRDSRLRWPVPEVLAQRVIGETVRSVRRRAKYILIEMAQGHVMVHLGMSGSLRLSSPGEPPSPHDHVEFEIDGSYRLRLRDPRRFGSVLWIEGEPDEHPLLVHLGIEPLSQEFVGSYLYSASRRRKAAVKNFIMDSRIVVGVGNIYASESLYRAGIDPRRTAGRISVLRYDSLTCSIQQTLRNAIAAGGTTLRDFVDGSGNPGYFRHDLKVYDREGKPCFRCGREIVRWVIGQRSTYFCRRCQK